MEVWVRRWEGGRERLRLNGSVGEEVGGREGEKRKGRDGWMEGERQERGRREGG